MSGMFKVHQVGQRYFFEIPDSLLNRDLLVVNRISKSAAGPRPLADRQIERDLLPTAKELGIGVVAFANTAEGLFTGEMQAPLSANDYRNHFTRFQGENLIKNLEKADILKQMAKEKGHTPTQLAIAWVNGQGDHIMPLVSMSRRSRLPENLQAMEIGFSADELNTLNTHFSPGAIAGGTYLQR